MKRTDFEGMCELAQEGRLTWVENMDSHEKGRVVSCSGETIEVETSGHRETWSLRDCKELTYGYKVNYEEVKRHPHEFDTHLDTPPDSGTAVRSKGGEYETDRFRRDV
jgi:hypothetical protein